MIRNAVEKAPSGSRPSNDVAIGYYRNFEELFFNSCRVELTKVNYFFAHKQAEAHRKLATLNYQLDRRRAQQDPRGSTASRAQLRPGVVSRRVSASFRPSRNFGWL